MTVNDFLASLPADRRATITAARKLVRDNIPAGYEEGMGWGMIMYSIPLTQFPNTYNGHPLCYLALASQKSHCAFYLMGAYGDPKQQAVLKSGFKRAGKKLDMGKSCLRFQTLDDLDLDSLGRVIASMKPEQMMAAHDAAHSKAAVAARRKARKTSATSSTRRRK